MTARPASPAARHAARRPSPGRARRTWPPSPAATDRDWLLSVAFPAPGGRAALVARWHGRPLPADSAALLEDAAHSLRLALEREEAWFANQETAALRRSRELQRGFLSRLSHELRTPLTAIKGYASSLLQTDVTWDDESEQRFLTRIAAESSRLGRLVDDLLRFSAIESGVLQLQRDWCDIPLVLDAAIACLPPSGALLVGVRCAADLPPIWADHDRLEQVFVNLLANAVGHNPPGTRVMVTASRGRPGYGAGQRGRQRARDAARRRPGPVRADAPPPLPQFRLGPGAVHRPGHRRGARRPDGTGPAGPGHLLPDPAAGGEPREPGRDRSRPDDAGEPGMAGTGRGRAGESRDAAEPWRRRGEPADMLNRPGTPGPWWSRTTRTSST